MPTTPPALTPVLEFPATGDPAFNAKAFAWGTAERTTTAPEIAALAANAYANAIEGADSAAQAAISATTAATQVALAATQVALATTQAGIATTQATNAGTSATQAAASAAIATNAANVQGTSTSSVSVPAVDGQSRTFVYAEADRTVALGMFVLVAATASPATNWMVLQVTSWTPGTRTLIGDVVVYSGIGTFAAWTLSLTGPRGAIGPSSTVNYSYANRGNLRSSTPADGAQAVVEGLGLFVHFLGSAEVDDGESAFATSAGVWVLQAASPEQSQAYAQIADNEITNRFLREQFHCPVTSIGPRSEVQLRVRVVGAEPGDAVVATPPQSGYGSDAGSASSLSWSAWVSAPDVVILSLRNGYDLASAGLAPGFWSILVVKE